MAWRDRGRRYVRADRAAPAGARGRDHAPDGAGRVAPPRAARGTHARTRCRDPLARQRHALALGATAGADRPRRQAARRPRGGGGRGGRRSLQALDRRCHDRPAAARHPQGGALALDGRRRDALGRKRRDSGTSRTERQPAARQSPPRQDHGPREVAPDQRRLDQRRDLRGQRRPRVGVRDRGRRLGRDRRLQLRAHRRRRRRDRLGAVDGDGRLPGRARRVGGRRGQPRPRARRDRAAPRGGEGGAVALLPAEGSRRTDRRHDGRADRPPARGVPAGTRDGGVRRRRGRRCRRQAGGASPPESPPASGQ